MKKIIALYSLISWISLIIFFIGVLIVIIIYNDHNFLLIGLFIGLVIISVFMTIVANPKFEIDLDTKTITLFRVSLIDPYINREKRHKIDKWNNEIDLENVQRFTIRKLTKDEKKKYIGSKYLFNKYLIVEMKNNSYKYLNISLFSNNQINYIINTIQLNLC